MNGQLLISPQATAQASLAWSLDLDYRLEPRKQLDRETLKEDRWTSHFESVEKRLQGLELPPKFRLDQIMDHLRQNDLKEAHRENRNLIFDQEWAHAIALDRFQEKSKSKTLEERIGIFDDLVNSIRERNQLLRAERQSAYSSFLYNCIEGDIPSEVIVTYSISVLWEDLGSQVVSATLLDPVQESAHNARSLQSLDELVRRLRKDQSLLSIDKDKVLTSRERLRLIIDIWNSGELGEIYTNRPWLAEPLERSNWLKIVETLSEETKHLKNRILREYPIVLDLLVPSGPLLPLAGGLFRAMMDEEIPA